MLSRRDWLSRFHLLVKGSCQVFTFHDRNVTASKSSASTATNSKTADRRSPSWAMLIKRVYELDPLTCPECRGQMAMVAFIESPQAEPTGKILRHCGLWRSSTDRAPPGNAGGDGLDGYGRSYSDRKN